MHPVLIEIHGFVIYTYGFFLAAAFGAAIYMGILRARPEGISKDTIIDLSVYIIVGSIIGARFLYVCVEWDEFKDDLLEILYVYNGGLVYYGGLIGASIAVIYFCWSRNIRLWQIADISAPSLAIGQMLGRIGCFFNGCCYGKETSCVIGVVFPAVNDTIAYLPTQLFESGACLVLFGILHILFKKRSFYGQVFFSYIILYSIARFVIEIYRGDDRGGFFFNYFSVSQLISIAGLIIGILLYLKNRTTLIHESADRRSAI